MNIPGKKVLIRAIEEGDLLQLHAWANDPEIWPNLGGWHFPSNFDSLQGWYTSLKADTLNQRFAIQAVGSGELLGTANLVQIDWKNNHAFHGMMLGKEHRGKGYATDTVMAIMRYVFDELHFARLDTDIIEYNQASLKLYIERCGWKEEGRLRQWYFRQGRYWDKLLVGATQDDYRQRIARDDYWKI